MNEAQDVSAHVNDPARLAALRAVALLDTPAEEAFDRLTWLATRCAHAPTALVSLIDADRQFFKSAVGLPEPWQSRRETPLSHSFCQYNRVASTPLRVEDARTDELFKNNLAIEDLNVVAYLGIPLITSDGYVLGSFCVIDSKPRKWTDEELTVVQHLAAAVMTEIQLRAEISSRKQAEKTLNRQNAEVRKAYTKLEKETAERLRAADQLRQRDQLLIQQSRLAAMGEMISNIAHQWRQPLNMLALLAQELPVTYQEREAANGRIQTTIRKMMETIARMSKTIDSFMNYFRPWDHKSNFSLLEMVQQTLSLLDGTFHQAQITTSVVAPCEPIVNGYPNDYAQVLLDILINARDAFVTRKVGNPSIIIEVGMEGGRSVVTITDNAGGVPEEIVDRIFEPYFTTKGPDKGTGIGLYMSKMIIENNMGGSLRVANVNGGAQFRIVV